MSARKNSASRDNGKKGGRPRARLVLRGAVATYIWECARARHGADATEQQALAIVERLVEVDQARGTIYDISNDEQDNFIELAAPFPFDGFAERAE